ncbi:hypothetical protein GVX82_04060 [Patescibacteria group bacterium]|jgi:hypothetical protein|nr:hypothetical protein [Patescibacteria group bacterium]
MALFREHLSVGAVAALALVATLYFSALLTDPLLLGILFFVSVVASFAPDLDSDESIPFRILFGAFTIGVTWVTFEHALTYFRGDLPLLIGVPSAAFLLTWFGLGFLFKAYTRHRGMFHSVPAAVIVALATHLLARSYLTDESTTWLFALGAGLGYLTHLTLDELYATRTLSGNPFTPKRSLGTALKFASRSRWRTLLSYLILAALVARILVT